MSEATNTNARPVLGWTSVAAAFATGVLLGFTAKVGIDRVSKDSIAGFGRPVTQFSEDLRATTTGFARLPAASAVYWDSVRIGRLIGVLSLSVSGKPRSVLLATYADSAEVESLLAGREVVGAVDAVDDSTWRVTLRSAALSRPGDWVSDSILLAVPGAAAIPIAKRFK